MSNQEEINSGEEAGSSPVLCSTLGTDLPKEIERCQELLGIYKLLGPVGAFGYAAISADIRAAHKAMIEGDAVGMARAYEALKGCE